MEQVCVETRAKWRNWLAKNHDKVKDGIWLVYYKKHTEKLTLDYGESVEEALCFGWIDSLIRKIDEDRYCRKFTPRTDDSNWSPANKKRVEKLIKEDLMTPIGLAKVKVAKESGKWDQDNAPHIPDKLPQEFAKALEANSKAKTFFESLASGYQKYFVAWIAAAKRPQTQSRRIAESIQLLHDGKKLDMK
jgi:uncharacterized protein YdeI (YjbR/CyaY-like superfamily)